MLFLLSLSSDVCLLYDYVLSHFEHITVPFAWYCGFISVISHCCEGLCKMTPAYPAVFCSTCICKNNKAKNEVNKITCNLEINFLIIDQNDVSGTTKIDTVIQQFKFSLNIITKSINIPLNKKQTSSMNYKNKNLVQN